MRPSGQLKKTLDTELKTNKSVETAARQAVVADADQLSKDAKTLRSRVKDGKPSSAEAERVLTAAAKMQTFIQGQRVPASASAWSAIDEPLRNVASAYGVPPPGVR
jgi:hypothetical protein